jgi:hypothetical protein
MQSTHTERTSNYNEGVTTRILIDFDAVFRQRTFRHNSFRSFVLRSSQACRLIDGS